MSSLEREEYSYSFEVKLLKIFKSLRSFDEFQLFERSRGQDFGSVCLSRLNCQRSLNCYRRHFQNFHCNHLRLNLNFFLHQRVCILYKRLPPPPGRVRNPLRRKKKEKFKTFEILICMLSSRISWK